MLATLLIDSLYEECKDELPPFMLEFDLAGGLTFDDDMALIEGGEIKSSTSRMFLQVIAHSAANSLIAECAVAEEQLFRRFVLLHAYVNILFPDIEGFKAMGFVYALRMRKDRGIKDITKLNYMPGRRKGLEIIMQRQVVSIL